MGIIHNHTVLTIQKLFGKCEQYTINSMVYLPGNEVALTIVKLKNGVHLIRTRNCCELTKTEQKKFL